MAKTMTQRAVKANQANARKSTGPRSAAGKALVAQNRTVHGLTGARNLIPGEDPAEYERLRAAVAAELAPCGELEKNLAERAAGYLWRLQRLGRVEAGLYALQHLGINEQRQRDKKPDLMALALGYEADAPDPARQEPLPTLGQAYANDCIGAGALEKLTRYESATERGLFRTLHELERLQRRRQGEPVPAPAVVELNVNNMTEIA